MNPTAPGADERRTRANLLRILNGPPAVPPAPPVPGRPRADWWERLYDEGQDDHAGAAPKRRRIPPVKGTKAPPDGAPEWEDAEPDDESTPQAVARTRRDPVRRMQVEFAGLERRAQWAISTGAGAGIGWALGLERLFARWIASCAHDTTPGSGLILGLGLLAACSYIAYATRRWWPPLAWACRIPASTALLAVCLFAPGVTP